MTAPGPAPVPGGGEGGEGGVGPGQGGPAHQAAVLPWCQCGVGHRSRHSLLILLVTSCEVSPAPTWGWGLSIAP